IWDTACPGYATAPCCPRLPGIEYKSCRKTCRRRQCARLASLQMSAGLILNARRGMHTISSMGFGRAQREVCVWVLGAALASPALASPLEPSAADANVVSRSVYERGVQAKALL